MDEFGSLIPAYLRHHHGQEGVGGNVEGDAEKHVGASLIQLTAQFPLPGLANSAYIELEEAMARRKGHPTHLGHVPCGYDMAAGIGIGFKTIDDIGYLVDWSIWGRPMAPLVSVYGAEIAVSIRPFIPYGDIIIMEIFDTGISFQEPEELVDDGAQVKLLGCQAGEALG